MNFSKKTIYEIQNSLQKISLDKINDEPLLPSLFFEPIISGILHRSIIKSSNGKSKFLKYSQRIFAELQKNFFLQYEKRSLVFHSNSERDFFKSKPFSVIDINKNWQVLEKNSKNCFELSSKTGQIIHFKSDSSFLAQMWIKFLKKVIENENDEL